MEKLVRCGVALLAPPLLFGFFAILITDGGWALFWLLLATALAVGAAPIVTSEWRWPIKAVTLLVYLPVMAAVVVVSGLLISCSVHGCH
jgi:hypothetical protein